MEEMRNKNRYHPDDREEAPALEEEAVEAEQSRLSRVARNQEKKQSRTKSRTQSSKEPAANQFSFAAKACGEAILRYLRYFYTVLKHPVMAMRNADEMKAKYGYVSFLLFAVLFSIGNFIQLVAGRERMLGFGVSHPFYEAFLVVLLFVLAFLLVSAGSIWAVAKYVIRNPFSFKAAINQLSLLMVPQVVLTLLWTMLSIPNVLLLTSILSAFGLCYYLFSIYALIDFTYQSSGRPLLDLFYCAGSALLIQVVFVSLIWRFISDYLLSSLIPI